MEKLAKKKKKMNKTSCRFRRFLFTFPNLPLARGAPFPFAPRSEASQLWVSTWDAGLMDSMGRERREAEREAGMRY